MIKLPYKKTILPNGLRIITVPMKNTNTITSIVFVKTGSRYEDKKENGISHVLEHMFFQGTKKRPDQMTIMRELNRIGAQSNAFTSQDHTAYYVKAEAKYLDLSLDVLSDMYLNALFKPEAIEKERRVIVEEINMYKDNPQRQVWDNFYELIYPGNSLGWPIAGPIKTVLSFKKENFIDYRKRFYLAQNTVIVVAGNFHEKLALDKIKSYFKNISVGDRSRFSPFIDNQTKPAINLQYKDIDQAHLVLGVKTFSGFDKRRYTLDLLSTVLGGYFSSRLVMSVRDKLGLAYYVGASASFNEDTGFLAVYAGLNLKNVDKGIKAILKEFEKVKNNFITKEELDDAKSHFEGAMSLVFESSKKVAIDFGNSEILQNKIETPVEYLKNINRVSLEDIKAVAKDIFKNNKLNLAIIGPFRDKNKFKLEL